MGKRTGDKLGKEHSTHSTYREKALEHSFIGECLRHLWSKGIYDAEVLQADVDAAGYDVVMEVNGNTRHIQLKSSIRRKQFQNINVKLMDKPSGCVVWIICDENNLTPKEFFWFGGKVGKPLPDIKGGRKTKHRRLKSGERTVRPNTYKVPKTKFSRLSDYDEVLERLFKV